MAASVGAPAEVEVEVEDEEEEEEEEVGVVVVVVVLDEEVDAGNGAAGVRRITWIVVLAFQSYTR